jgi:predicted nucleic acid-binding protein
VSLILDTGPLYASLDRTDADYLQSRRLLEFASEQLVVPAPVLVEVACFCERRLHTEALLSLLENVAMGGVLIEDLVPSDYQRARDLCERYADASIGFVDAAVLAIVERLNEPKLATLDHRHFSMMRPRHVDSLRLLPD